MESVLAVLHRRKGEQGNYGGPMYVMADRGWKKTAVLFSLCGVGMSLLMANALPSGALATALRKDFAVPVWVTGLVLAALALVTVFGGKTRIEKVSGVVVPVMSLFFLAASLWIIFAQPQTAWFAVGKIFREAFSLKAGVGGLLGGAMRFGLSRGIYSNEAGMGTEPILAAATAEKNAHRQGLISMTGPFLDTVIFCTFTALVVVMADLSSGDAANLVGDAFAVFLPGAGQFIVDSTLALLVFATIASWAFYGEQCLSYLTGNRFAIPLYRLCYGLVPLCFAGANLSSLFALNDILSALMAIPNLILCILSVSEVKRCQKQAFLVNSSVDG